MNDNIKPNSKATTPLATLLNNLPQEGRLNWIGIRPQRRATVQVRSSIKLDTETGLEGDRYRGRSGKRQVTLIQHEHLTAIASLLHTASIDPAQLRRNLVVEGINLLALKGRHFCVGPAILEFTGLCHPCSYMEEIFGDGGYNAVRGHGGITARVLTGGIITVGDSVTAINREDAA